MDTWIRTSAVVAEHAAVSSDQPLATNIGLSKGLQCCIYKNRTSFFPDAKI